MNDFNIQTITQEQKDRIYQLYCVEKRGQLYCANELGISVYKFKGLLKKMQIPIRNFSEAAVASNKNRAKKKNENYFDTQTSNMAWLLGFLASDGTVGKNNNTIKIGLSRVDREILEKIKAELEIENTITDYTTHDGYECSSLRWTSERHKQQLQQYSIIPQKTFNLKPPYKLDEKYWIDYIRGYFDGDGSINLIQNRSLRWQVGSATIEILEFILTVFQEKYGIPKVKIQKDTRGKNSFYYIQYSTNAVRKIHSILYTPNSLALQRKQEHFNNIVK